MNKTIIKTVLLTIAALLVLKAGFLLVDHMHAQAAADQKMEQMMQAIAADPDAVTVTEAQRDVTDAFLNAHLEELQAGNYREAIDEIRENQYTVGLATTPKNRDILESQPNLTP